MSVNDFWDWYKAECTTNMILAKATIDAQINAIVQQTSGHFGFSCIVMNLTQITLPCGRSDCYLSKPHHEEPYGRVVVWQDPFENCWVLLQRNDL